MPQASGFERFAEDSRRDEPERIDVRIDDCPLSCNENEEEEQARKLEEFYNKNRARKLFEDKHVKIYSMICLASL